MSKFSAVLLKVALPIMIGALGTIVLTLSPSSHQLFCGV